MLRMRRELQHVEAVGDILRCQRLPSLQLTPGRTVITYVVFDVHFPALASTA